MINKDDIASWLDSQSDFTLEMKVFSLTTSLGFEAEHGGTYSDPVTDRPRQFDIRSIVRNQNRSIKLAIECKSLSTEFPLVIQRVPRTEKESFHDVMYAYEPDSGLMGVPNVFDNSKILRTSTGSPLYPIAQPVGKSSNQIGKKNDKLFANDKEIYDKWAQAISSAHDLVDDSVYERDRLGFDDSFSFIIPVLILPDDCLWCVDYDKEGKRLAEPKMTNETSFYISKEYWKKGQMHEVYTASHLHILTFSGYKHFVGDIASNIRFWAEVYPPNNLSEKE